jgi:GH15 family glucan-1,4-alpha-glucosidase
VEGVEVERGARQDERSGRSSRLSPGTRCGRDEDIRQAEQGKGDVMPYQPIEDYGIIGDLHTAALVGRNGSIDWLCLPHFDSPSVFARILDSEKGGWFRIAPAAAAGTARQFYLPETNVLVTRFLTYEGAVEIVDYMPVRPVPDQMGVRHDIVRRITGLRGTMHVRMDCVPAFNYARDGHETIPVAGGVFFRCPGGQAGLYSDVPLLAAGKGVHAELTLREGESAAFVFGETQPGETDATGLARAADEAVLARTVAYWRKWISQCTYNGRWRETVHRSLLVLKLLTYAPTGAIIAAPTAGLPEEIGGERNWDYRYTWIRDASFTLYALLRVGFSDEAKHFMEWLQARSHEAGPDGTIRIMYGIDGRHELPEITLDHLEGYKGSRPVRIGNGAYDQLQLDIYGELMDSVYLYNKYGARISYDLWVELVRMLDWVCRNWTLKDDGIWEVRGGRRHFVYSKLMCWVALDRGLRLAAKRSFPADEGRWKKVRDEIYLDILKNGWCEERQAFVQAYGRTGLDASVLVMPLVFFMSPTDPRMLKTLDAIMRPPSEGGLLSNSLVYRYNVHESPDGLSGEEGAFSMCTFWLVEALTRAGAEDPKRLDQARLIFEQMLGYSNHLGLYSEEVGPTGEALGNFPQAFTHIALISAAFKLDRALGAGA